MSRFSSCFAFGSQPWIYAVFDSSPAFMVIHFWGVTTPIIIITYDQWNAILISEWMYQQQKEEIGINHMQMVWDNEEYLKLLPSQWVVKWILSVRSNTISHVRIIHDFINERYLLVGQSVFISTSQRFLTQSFTLKTVAH